MIGDGEEVEQAAALWVAKASLGSLDPSDRLALDAWLAADARHRAAFDRLGGALASVDAMGGLVRETHAKLKLAARRRRRAATCAAAILLLVLPFVDFPLWLADARTERGEVRVVALADGSKLWLDADSAVDIDLDAQGRRIAVVRGRVHAEVAHRPIPFVVSAAGGEIHDIGTAFDVERLSAGAQVVVTAGRVEARAGLQKQLLGAGEGARWHEGGGLERLGPREANAAGDWREGRLRFEDRPLGEVIAALDRYSAKRLLLFNDAAARRRVSGVVRISRADQDIAALARSQGLVPTEIGPAVLLR